MAIQIEARKAFGRCAQANRSQPCLFARTINDDKQKVIAKHLGHLASQLDWNRVIGLIDTSSNGNATAGILVCDTKAYFYGQRKKPRKVWYDEISKIAVSKPKAGINHTISLSFKDGSSYSWKCEAVSFRPLATLFLTLNKLNSNATNAYNSINVERTNVDANAETGGLAAGNRGVVNKIFDEERFHARQGHGFAAERANNLEDRLHGRKAKIEGDNNVKNGPDRSVTQPDGTVILIQSKYHSTGRASIDACFDSEGNFRYWDNGKPMVIEVASDKYDDAVRAMGKKIEAGKVAGVTDPAQAEKIVKPGNFTYEQVKNIAKAGNVDSIIYDAKSGAIISLYSFGISTAITFAVSLWNGDEPAVALKNAALSGIRVGGTTFLTAVIAGQIAKSSLSSVMTPGFQALAKSLSPKVYAALANAFRNGTNITGAAAANSAAKLLKGNAISAAATMAVLTMFDVKDIVQGRISSKQMVVNTAKTATTVATGAGGWLSGSALGTLILPGIGTVVGGFLGSLVAGGGSGVIVGKLTDKFIDTDSDRMLRLVEAALLDICGEYLLNQDETEKVCDGLGGKLDSKTLKKMHASKDRYWYARELIEPLAVAETGKRLRVMMPAEELMNEGIDAAFADIAQGMEGVNSNEQ